jgi:hypothetical protein
MSKGIYNTYGSRAVSPSTNYPEGIFKDETSPGMENGTPLQRDWAINIEAMFQRIRAEGHVTNSENLETSPVCQTWHGLIRRLGNAPPQATPEEICAELPETDWSDPAATPNYLDTGYTIVDSCIGYNHNSSKHYLWVLCVDGASNYTIRTVSGWGDYSASPTLSGAITFNWAVTPDEIFAICSDGYYLYVAWNQTAGQVYISKFLQTGFTGDIVYTWGTGVVPDNLFKVSMCTASSTRLGFAIDNVSGIYIGSLIKSSSTISSDYFSGYHSDGYGFKLVSDGTNMYCIGRDESGAPTYAYYILQAQITDPTTQDTHHVVTNLNKSLYPVAIQRVKGMIVVTNIIGTVYALFGGSVQILFEALPFSEYYDSYQYSLAMGTDGRSIYAMVVEDDSAGSAGYYSVFKLPIHQFLSAALDSPLVATDNTRIRIEQTPAAVILTRSSLLYDGLDMWLVQSSGEIYRICDTR